MEIPQNFREPSLFQKQREDAKQILFARVDFVDTLRAVARDSPNHG